VSARACELIDAGRYLAVGSLADDLAPVKVLAIELAWLARGVGRGVGRSRRGRTVARRRGRSNGVAARARVAFGLGGRSGRLGAVWSIHRGRGYGAGRQVTREVGSVGAPRPRERERARERVRARERSNEVKSKVAESERLLLRRREIRAALRRPPYRGAFGFRFSRWGSEVCTCERRRGGGVVACVPRRRSAYGALLRLPLPAVASLPDAVTASLLRCLAAPLLRCLARSRAPCDDG